MSEHADPRPDPLDLPGRADSALARREWLAGAASAGALAGPIIPMADAAPAAPSFPADTLGRIAWGLTGYVVPDRQVPGVDIYFIGSGDLSRSMGYAGQPAHPEVMERRAARRT